MRAGVAVGANLGDRLATMRTARESVRVLPRVSGPLISSSVYETEPVGCEAGAHLFLNAAIEFAFDGDPLDLLHGLRAIEAAFGRDSEHVRNSSRTIDLDLLYCDDEQIDSPELQLPHPRLTQRRFVLQPLADIRPELVLPGQSDSVKTLLSRLPISPTVVRSGEQW